MTMIPSSLHTVVAIDGPAASGKSSVSRAVAKRLGFSYINSGNLYRAATWSALHNGGLDTPAFPSQLFAFLNSNAIHSCVHEQQIQISVNDCILESELSEEKVNQAVSIVAKLPEVRSWVLERLRSFALEDSIVMEGRDIGSVVFPDARFKFYLDASPEIREQRRRAQGIDDAIRERDRQDTTRKEAPLVTAPDAIVIDSTNLNFEETVQAILSHLASAGLTK